LSQLVAVARDAFGEAPLLRGVSDHVVAELSESAREVRVEAREWLFREGDAADRLFVVLSGRLQVVAAGDGRLLREVGPGAALGELGLLTGSERSASVRAMRDSRLLALDADSVVRLLELDGGFALSVARELARQLQASGGLALSETRPSVFTVVPAGSGAAAPFVAELAIALERFGSVVALDGGDLAPEDFAAVLERAEEEFAHVLLLDRPDAWGDFCRRQCDRLLVVAGGTAPEQRDRVFEGCELVLEDVPKGAVEGWLDAIHPRSHHVLPAGEPRSAGAARVARRVTQRSLGVVLSGGGARGFAHIGALAALAEAGFEFDRIGGCSMGSLIAAMGAVGFPPEEIEARCREELVRRSPFNDYTLPRVSLIRSRKATAMLERIFGDALVEELSRSLFTVSADLLTSRVVVHRRGRVTDAVAASMSIPGVAPPFRQAGRLLVDGGVLNNLPVDHMAEVAEGPIVAVDVIRRMDGPAEGEPALPGIAETLARATVLGSVERAESNRALALLLVTPDVESIKLRAWSALDVAVEAGRVAALTALEHGGAEKLQAALDAE
jgi:NTE family protein